MVSRLIKRGILGVKMTSKVANLTTITCWCSRCVIRDYENCVESDIEGSGWKLVDLAPMTWDEARHQRTLVRLPAEVYNERFVVKLKPLIFDNI